MKRVFLDTNILIDYIQARAATPTATSDTALRAVATVTIAKD